MAVLPESMDKLNVQDVPGSLSKLQDYIRYMGERLEFSFHNLGKTVSAAGVSSLEIYLLLQAQEHAISAMEGVLNTHTGEITTLKQQASTLGSELSALSAAISALEERVAALEEEGESEVLPEE